MEHNSSIRRHSKRRRLNRRFTQNQVQAGFSYKFDLAAPAPVVAKY